MKSYVKNISKLLFICLVVQSMNGQSIEFNYKATGSLGSISVEGNFTVQPTVEGNTSPLLLDTLRYEINNVGNNTNFLWNVIGGDLIGNDSTSIVQIHWISTPMKIEVQEIPEEGCPSEVAVLNLKPAQIQNVPLYEGWNLISTYMDIYDSTIVNVMDNISPTLELVKDEYGTYFHNQPPPFNTLSALSDGQGYWLKVSEDDTLQVAGLPLIADSVNISLVSAPSWNLIGYPNQSSLTVDSALSSIMPYVLKVKNIDDSFDPSFPPIFNTLDSLRPGEGYWVQVSEDINLSYPQSSSFSGKVDTPKSLRFENPTGWKRIAYPSSMITYGFVTLNDIPVSDGYIGAFVGEECRAIAAIKTASDSSYVSMVINGEPSDSIYFKLWTNDYIYTNDLILNLSSNGQNNTLLPLRFHGEYNAIKESIIEDYIKVFPNPFSQSIHIEWSNYLSDEDHLSLKIINTNGSVLNELFFKNNDNLEINFKEFNYPSGVYLLGLTIGEKTYFKRIIYQIN